jgi:hypothetical protein
MRAFRFFIIASFLTISSYLSESKAFSLNFLQRGFFHCLDGPSACTKRADLCSNQAAFDECYEKCIKARRHDGKTPLILERLLKCSPETYQKSKFLQQLKENANRYGKEITLPPKKNNLTPQERPKGKLLPEVPTQHKPQLGTHRKPLPEIPSKSRTQEITPEEKHKPLPELPPLSQKKEAKESLQNIEKVPEKVKESPVHENDQSEMLPPPPPPREDWTPKKIVSPTPKIESPIEKSKKQSDSSGNQDLLSEIQKGVILKKAEPIAKPKTQQDLIAQALKKRREAIEDNEDEEEEDDELFKPSSNSLSQQNKNLDKVSPSEPRKLVPTPNKPITQPKTMGDRMDMLGNIRSFDPKTLRKAQPVEKKKEMETSPLFNPKKIEEIREHFKNDSHEEEDSWDE